MRPSDVTSIVAQPAYTNYSSPSIPTGSVFAGSVQAVTSGTGAGTVKIQASNDPYLPESEPVNWTDVASITTTLTGTAGSFLIPKFDVCYQWLRTVFTSTATGVQHVLTLADTAGSLNSKYFLLNSSSAGIGYYVWFNVNSAGVDPAIANRTGQVVLLSTGATNSQVATAAASAIDGLANFVSTATSNNITITNAAAGPFTPASDGNSGFTFSVTTPSGTVSANVKTLGA